MSNKISAESFFETNGLPSIYPEKTDDLEYDLGHLLVSDLHPFECTKDYQQDLENLKKITLQNTQLLVNKIFALERCGSDTDLISVKLPAPELKLPREKPIPVEKTKTRWETFAERKGIHKKDKRERMEYDEDIGEYRPRWGYGRNSGGDIEKDWLMPVKKNADFSKNPYDEIKEQKKERRQKEIQLQNANKKRRS